MPRKSTLVFILAVVLIDVTALGLVIPVLAPLIRSMVNGDTAEAAWIYGVFATSWGLMQFLFSPLLGSLSDRFGRRPLLILSCLGTGCDYLIMALAPSLLWLFVGRVLSGMTTAGFATAYAYIADETPEDRRAGAFGLVGAAFGVGFVLGPAIGGLLGMHDPRLPFWFASGFSFANAVYGFFVVPESLPKDRRMPFSLARANPLGALKLLRRHATLLGLGGVVFLDQLALTCLPAVTVLYTAYRFGWGAAMVGMLLAAVGLGSIIVNGLLVQPIVTRLGNRLTLMLGLIGGGLGFAVYGAAETSTWFWVGIPLMSLWGLSDPAALGMMSRYLGGSEQGQLQGANASIMALCGLLGPSLFSLTFAVAIPRGLPGAPFLLAALLLLSATLLACYVTRTRPAPWN